MQNHLALFGRPLSFDVTPVDLLSVTGILPKYSVEEAYTGTLNVNNAHGKFRVQVLNSDLPNGYAVRADNVAGKLVVTWPAYDETPDTLHDVANGGFDNGDANWTFGPGWSAFVGYGNTNNTSARFLGYTGRSLSVGSLVPYNNGRIINLGCMVQQGASPKHKAGAQAVLRWYDVAGNVIKDDYGTLIDSGKGGDWQESRIATVGPTNAAHVSPCFSGMRVSKNDEVWVDNVNWDYKYSTGTNVATTYHLSVKVTDSENRSFIWTGIIGNRSNNTQTIFATGGDGTIFFSWNPTDGLVVPPTFGVDTNPAGATNRTGLSNFRVATDRVNGKVALQGASLNLQKRTRVFPFSVETLWPDFSEVQSIGVDPDTVWGMGFAPDGVVVGVSAQTWFSRYDPSVDNYDFARVAGVGTSHHLEFNPAYPNWWVNAHDSLGFLATKYDTATKGYSDHRVLTGPAGVAWGACWSPDGSYCACSGIATTNSIIIYKFDPSAETFTLVGSFSSTVGYRSMKWSPSGKYLVGMGQDDSVTFEVWDWDGETAELTNRRNLDPSGLLSHGTSDANDFVITDDDGTLFFNRNFPGVNASEKLRGAKINPANFSLVSVITITIPESDDISRFTSLAIL